jgi:N6-L-threonylcarbamoyladenine synthase
MHEPIILGIETSCDETAVAVLKGNKNILSNLIVSQIDIHKAFGGVVPEIASRKHIEYLYKLTEKALVEAKITIEDVSAVAVTYGPGLAGALLIGLNFAKGLSLNYNIPLIKVNHLMGHIYANFLSYPDLEMPFIVLLVSGGHTMIIKVDDYNSFEIIGNTRDDAVGEAFDKVARIVGLGYPGGPAIEKIAGNGNPVYNFPKPMMNKGYDFSFSGLKTAVLYFLKNNPESKIEDVACSFQKTVAEILTEKVTKASKENNIKNIVIAGGVAANKVLRKSFDDYKNDFNIYYPDLIYCTDNAAMIARAGYEKYIRNDFGDMSADAVPNLSLKEI